MFNEMKNYCFLRENFKNAELRIAERKFIEVLLTKDLVNAHKIMISIRFPFAKPV